MVLFSYEYILPEPSEEVFAAASSPAFFLLFLEAAVSSA